MQQNSIEMLKSDRESLLLLLLLLVVVVVVVVVVSLLSLLRCVRGCVKRAITKSFSLVSKMECLQELDLRRNLIGDLGAVIVLDALQQRKEGIIAYSADVVY